MAASSPAFDTRTADRVRRDRIGGGALSGALSPSIGLPLRFVVAGVGSLLVAAGMLLARPELLSTYHYNQHIIAVTHLVVLGFVTSVVMGATYQLVPVALETPLFSERLARWQFPVHLVGFVGMVWAFWVWDMRAVGHFGAVFALGGLMFAYNAGRTLWRARRRDAVALGIGSAMIWLVVTMGVGLAITTAKHFYNSTADPGAGWLSGALLRGSEGVTGWVLRLEPLALMHAHAHLGGVGIFLMMIVAVSYKLVPMFTLSELRSEGRARCSILLLNLGLAGLVVAMALHSGWKLLFAGVLVAGLAIYGVELAAILRARRRRVIDWGLRYYLTAMGLLGLTALLGLVLCWPGLPATVFTTQLENLYGILGFLGVFTLTILGFLHKIVPFLVWYRAYSPVVGRQRVPSLGALFSERLQVGGLGVYLAALASIGWGTATGSSVGVRVGMGLLLAGLLVFAVNLAGMMRHLWAPRVEPLED